MARQAKDNRKKGSLVNTKRDDDSPTDATEEVDEQESSEEEEMEKHEDEEGDEENGDDNADEEETWPKTDDNELLKRIRNVCPKNDRLSYQARSNRIDWEKIKFQDYTAEQCKTRWNCILARLRHYRNLSEVLDEAVLWVDTPWFHFYKNVKNRHPDLPKRPLTSFMIYYMQHKDAVLEKQPSLGMPQLSKVLGEMYRELSEEKKAKYAKLAEKEKESYAVKMQKFMNDHPDYVIPNAYATVKKVAPKLPTPFWIYYKEKMPTLVAEGLKRQDARERCTADYKVLSDKKKLKWIKKALQQEPEYKEKMEKFKAEHPDFDLSANKQPLLSKDEVRIKNKSDGKPEKPLKSGYSLFSKEQLGGKSLKGFEPKKKMQEISRLWNALSDEERDVYKQESKKLNFDFKMKFASYLETLNPEQRAAELPISSKNSKRVASKTEEQPIVKKRKIVSTAKRGSSSEMESDELETPPESSVQQPISALEMFCNLNREKYASKHPQMTKQELTKFMQKQYSKLNQEKKKVYVDLALNSKNNVSASSLKEPSSAKGKALKPSKNSLKMATGTSSKSQDPPNGFVAKIDSISEKSSSKLKPSLNGKPKSSKVNVSSSETPIWAVNQSLFMASNGATEPAKFPESVAAYFVAMHHSKVDLDEAEIDRLWSKLSDKHKQKWETEHSLKMAAYRAVFENFIRSLSSADLQVFSALMKERNAQMEEEDDDGNSSEDEESGQPSQESGSDDEDESD